MYVNPQSDIYLLKGIPLEPTYDHTLYFATEALQSGYFLNTVGIKQFTRQTYQRVNKGTLRITANANDINDYNYLMFRNLRTDTVPRNKWFYAFITRVEYVNENLTEVSYMIDELQTWFFEKQLEECFVEREHSVSDILYENLVPENLETGEYESEELGNPTTNDYGNILNDYSVIVAASVKKDPTTQAIVDVSGAFYNGLFGGLAYTIFNYRDYQTPRDLVVAITSFFTDVANAFKSSAIYCVFLAPTNMIDEDAQVGKTIEVTFPKKNSGDIINNGRDTYTPRNKKLYTYPYNFLYCTNAQGNAAAFPYEYFNTSLPSCHFNLQGDMCITPSVILYPRYFKGVDNNIDEKMILGGYPMLTYNTDAFTAWLAQNMGSLVTQGLATAGGLVQDDITHNRLWYANQANPSFMGSMIEKDFASGALISTGLEIAGTLANVGLHMMMPPQTKGAYGGQTLAADRMLNYYFYRKHIRKEFAEIIDKYFDMFGYATHKVKIPNINSRPHWNYVQTKGCKVGGNIPSEANAKICEIFNHGITFWKNPSEVGNYSLDNRPSA